jgi:hypothetical protein
MFSQPSRESGRISPVLLAAGPLLVVLAATSTGDVAAAHERGELPTYDDWRASQPKQPGLLSRLLRRS